MLRSMFAGLSGLVNHKNGLDVVGNNIANVNTIGYKAARVTFQDLLSQGVAGSSGPVDGARGGTNPQQVGLGMKMGSIDTIMTQGNLQTTGNFTDLAIEGNGFFVLSDDGADDRSYTRAGNFSFDAEGSLVHATGARVMGWMADDETYEVNTAGTLENIQLPAGVSIPAEVTTEIEYGFNLNALSYQVGQSLLQEGNTANVDFIDGAWDGVTDSAPAGTQNWNQVGTHTITVSSEKMTGQKTGSYLFTNRFQTLVDYTDAAYGTIANNMPQGDGVDTVPPGNTQYDGTDSNGNYWNLVIRTDRVHGSGLGGNEVEVPIYEDYTVEDVLNAINTNVTNVTASLLNGNIQLSHTQAGEAYTIEVSDSVNASAASGTLGIADLLFAERPDTDGTAANFGSISNYWASATIGWAFTPDSSTDLGFTATDTNGPGPTELQFSGGDTSITGMDGVVISAGTGGFKDGIISIESQAAETHSTTTKVYDSLGNGRNVTITFERVAENQWSWTASGTGVGGSGVIDFNTQGQVLDVSATAVSITGLNGSASQTVDIDIRDITQFAGESSVNAVNQDGYAQGDLESFTIDQRGVVQGKFSNGLNRTLAQIAVANFNNTSGLIKLGDSTWGESNNSGVPQVGSATVGGRGSVSTGTLEMSNVDVAREFSNMIIYQRGFQANAKMITTGDEMLTTLVNIKR